MSPEQKMIYLYLLTNPYTSNCGIFRLNFATMGFNLGIKEINIKTAFESFLLRFPGVIAFDEITKEVALLAWPKMQMGFFQQKSMLAAAKELEVVESLDLLRLMYQNSLSSRAKNLYEKEVRLRNINVINEKKQKIPENSRHSPQLPDNQHISLQTESEVETESESVSTNTETFSKKNKLKSLGIIETFSDKSDGQIKDMIASGIFRKKEEPKPEEPTFKPKPRKGNETLKSEEEYKDGLTALILKKVKRKGIVSEYLLSTPDDIGVDEFLESFVNYCFDNDVNYNGYFKGIPELMEIHANMLSNGETIIPKKAVISKKVNTDAHYQ